MDEAVLAGLREEPIDWRFKGFPPSSGLVTPARLSELGWNVVAGDLPLPAMVLKQSALRHNVSLMADVCREHGVLLAPHGKTTMAPEIFKMQLDAGAWGITVATLAQVRICRAFGVQRVVLANQLVEPLALAWVADELARDPEFDFYCLVDSVAALNAIVQAFDGRYTGRPLQVLLELGFTGGRTGCRSVEEAAAVAAAAARSPAIELVGVEAYEGIIHDESVEATLAAVDEFVGVIRSGVVALARQGIFDGRDRIVVSVGGSACFDRVLAGLAPPWPSGVEVQVVLRSGCYVTHDSAFYDVMSPLAGRSTDGRRLRPALEVWSTVLSRPERELALVGFGRRDAPFDIELPSPQLIRDGSGLRPAPSEMVVDALNDQHAYVRLPSEDGLDVGDLLSCGICHPCTAFDKWQLIPVVDDDYTVVDAIRTFF